MLSNKPYLIRAFYEWIVDSGCTPFLVINANFPRCHVPEEHVENGEITLNVAPVAVRDLKIGNDIIEFRASFSGLVHHLSAPIKAILAIYAEENQEGMFFDYEEPDEEEWADTTSIVQQQGDTVTKVQEKKKPVLKLVE